MEACTRHHFNDRSRPCSLCVRHRTDADSLDDASLFSRSFFWKSKKANHYKSNRPSFRRKKGQKKYTDYHAFFAKARTCEPLAAWSPLVAADSHNDCGCTIAADVLRIEKVPGCLFFFFLCGRVVQDFLLPWLLRCYFLFFSFP